MEIKILSPLWGHEHLETESFLTEIKTAGYDGVDSWIPEKPEDKKILFDYLQQNEMHIVTHQHHAKGSTFKKFKTSFIHQLQQCAEPGPLLINSHTGRDYFSLQQNLELVDLAEDFSAKTGILVTHETHRGRLGYCPQMTDAFFDLRPDFFITADFSHWVCVTESMLEHFTAILDKAIRQARHIHARIGFEQGPQVNDPRAPEWRYAVDKFLYWWDKIVAENQSAGTPVLAFTTEFGPAPYLPAMPYTQKPLADQFEINCYMKDLLKARYVDQP